MILDLIVQELEAMLKATDGSSIRLKRKAITTFFSYAVRQERDGQQKLIDTVLPLFRVEVVRGHTVSTLPLFGLTIMWHHIEPLISTVLNEENYISLKQVIILASPNLPWGRFVNPRHLIQPWAAAASAIPYTDDIGQSVVDALLQIAADPSLQPHIPADMWSWLNRPSSLPSACLGRFRGSDGQVVQVVRALGDIEILKSYLLLIWSEWDEPWQSGLNEMRASLREDFSGIGMGHHRQDLLRRLDDVLEQLDPEPEHLHFDTDAFQRMKNEYGELREVLLEVDRKAGVTLIRGFPVLIVIFGPLTPADRYRVSLDFYVCNPSSVSIDWKIS